jgi:hypothetical protein
MARYQKLENLCRARTASRSDRKSGPLVVAAWVVVDQKVGAVVVGGAQDVEAARVVVGVERQRGGDVIFGMAGHRIRRVREAREYVNEEAKGR